MPSSRRNFVHGFGVLSLAWLAGCTYTSSSSSASTDSNTSPTASPTETGATPEPYSPELTVVSLSDDVHTVGVRLGEFEHIPDGGGTPVESGTYIFNDEFELEPAEEVKLREYRKPGEHYNFVLIIDGNVVVDEFLDGSEGLTIEILDAEMVDIERTFI